MSWYGECVYDLYQSNGRNYMSRSEQSTLKEVLTQQIRDKMMPDSTVQKQFDQVFIFNIKTVKNTLITKRVLRAFLL